MMPFYPLPYFRNYRTKYFDNRISPHSPSHFPNNTPSSQAVASGNSNPSREEKKEKEKEENRDWRHSFF